MVGQEIQDAKQVTVAQEKIPVRNWWHMLLYAWDLAEFQDRFDAELEDAPDLRALLTSILVYLVKHQIRRGLRGDYVERSEELRGVRGRIDFGQTLRSMSMYRGRLHCEYEEFTLNVPRNQIIRSTLGNSLNHDFTSIEKNGKGRYGKLVSDLEALLRMLYEIDRVRVTARLIASELRLLGRNEREYKLMLKICEMLQDPSMNKEERQDTRVRLPTMKPDIVLTQRKTGSKVVIDTKFYGSVLYESGSGPTVNPDHVYQLYGYLQSLDSNDRRYPDSTGILLYARTNKDNVDFQTTIDSHPFRVYTLDLSKDWHKIEGDLLGVLD